jgi:Zn-dependent alcohol dehydrogenase
VVKVDPSIRKDVTSIIGCAVMTGAGAVINTAAVQPGQSVAVFGVGGVGLSAIVGAKVAGANPIIAVDLDDAKLEFARQFGATHGINASRQDPVEAIHALTARPDQFTIFQTPVSGVDFAFDCIGIRKTMDRSCRPAGQAISARATAGRPYWSAYRAPTSNSMRWTCCCTKSTSSAASAAPARRTVTFPDSSSGSTTATSISTPW